MSTASKVTLALTTLGSIGVIYSVHKNQVSQVKYTLSLTSEFCTQQHSTKLHAQTGSDRIPCCQVEDRAKLHDGIVRDLERQAKKKVVNQQQLVQQQELTKLYRKAEEKESSK